MAANIQVSQQAGDLMSWPGEVPLSANHHSEGGDNAENLLTLDADTNRPHVLTDLWVSFLSNPAAGALLSVEDGSGTIRWSQLISTAGPHHFKFDPARYGTKNTALLIRLAAGGAGRTSRIDITSYLKG